MITILYEESLCEAMIDKKRDEKEGEELQKMYNQSLNKREDIMNTTEISYHATFGNASREDISPEQKTKPHNFFN